MMNKKEEEEEEEGGSNHSTIPTSPVSSIDSRFNQTLRNVQGYIFIFEFFFFFLNLI